MMDDGDHHHKRGQGHPSSYLALRRDLRQYKLNNWQLNTQLEVDGITTKANRYVVYIRVYHLSVGSWRGDIMRV